MCRSPGIFPLRPSKARCRRLTACAFSSDVSPFRFHITMCLIIGFPHRFICEIPLASLALHTAAFDCDAGPVENEREVERTERRVDFATVWRVPSFMTLPISDQRRPDAEHRV